MIIKFNHLHELFGIRRFMVKVWAQLKMFDSDTKQETFISSSVIKNITAKKFTLQTSVGFAFSF